MTENNEQSTKGFFHGKLLTPFAAVLLVICAVAGTAAACIWRPAPEQTPDQLYQAAVIDSMTVEDDEIFPLVNITKESDMVTWKDGKVLLVRMNRQPEFFIEGATLTLPDTIWTFTNKEMSTWYSQNKDGVTDWPMRFRQLIGIPPDKEYTHVTAMWVSPEDICRPAYNSDISNDDMPSVLPEDTSPEYKAWFDENIIWSYFESAYPWTRLGYTYDWAAGCDEYGISEFLVKPDAEVTIEFTDTMDEFIERMKQGAV